MRYLGVAVFILAFLVSPLAHAAEQVIEIKNYHFMPPNVTVAPGTKITWINRDEVPHTVVEKQKAFRSSAMDTNDSYSFVIKDAGTYTYFCSLHPQMMGTITVAEQKN